MENNNTKHAYLIIAHNEEKVLQYLIKSIDDVRNDIYINIDKKSKELNEKELAKCLRYSNIYFLHEDVRWGDQSQVHCEILLPNSFHAFCRSMLKDILIFNLGQ